MPTLAVDVLTNMRAVRPTIEAIPDGARVRVQAWTETDGRILDYEITGEIFSTTWRGKDTTWVNREVGSLTLSTRNAVTGKYSPGSCIHVTSIEVVS